MSNKLAIGIDIGGTRTKFGLVDLEYGQVLDTMILPTERFKAPAFLTQIEMAVKQFTDVAEILEKKIAGIGMGIPGFIQGDGMVVTTYGFLEFMNNYPLKEIMQHQFSLPCLVDNDARIVSLGEALYGKGKSFKRVLTLTLGTGVGFGFVVDGRFIEPLPFAHMGGHIKINNDGAICYCGKTGCLEALVSSSGIINLAQQAGWNNKGTTEEIFAAASSGSEDALEVVEKVIDYLHIGIHNYVNLFAPDVIVLGGGIAKGLSKYLEKIKGKMYMGPYPGYDFKLMISALEEQAGILGSAALFQSFNN